MLTSEGAEAAAPGPISVLACARRASRAAFPNMWIIGRDALTAAPLTVSPVVHGLGSVRGRGFAATMDDNIGASAAPAKVEAAIATPEKESDREGTMAVSAAAFKVARTGVSGTAFPGEAGTAGTKGPAALLMLEKESMVPSSSFSGSGRDDDATAAASGSVLSARAARTSEAAALVNTMEYKLVNLLLTIGTAQKIGIRTYDSCIVVFIDCTECAADVIVSYMVATRQISNMNLSSKARSTHLTVDIAPLRCGTGPPMINVAQKPVRYVTSFSTASMYGGNTSMPLGMIGQQTPINY